jgi:hypothetical protein
MDIRNFKDDTKAAAAYLAEHGVDVPHTRLLEALARAFGERNWSTLSARLAQLNQPNQPALAATPCPPAEAPPVPWEPAHGPMSEDQYRAAKGNRCPFCGSREVEGGKLQVDGPHAWDESSCLDCHATWKSSYELTGYYDGEPGAAPTTVACIMLQHPGVMVGNIEGLAYEAAPALAVLAQLVADPAKFSPAQLLAHASWDEERSIELLQQHGIAPVARAVRRRPWDVHAALQEALRGMNKEFLPVRQDVVDDLVADVRDRARSYDFSVRGISQAYECALESAGTLEWNVSQAELLAAAGKLA